ncbi:hypothetical protein K1719_046223 [Acacia pycnantha]|nr:hypothetical protein K1719_046223 [Acacia pycnantha]
MPHGAPSSSITDKWSYDYDVYLSFCGEDTRFSFIDFLHHSLLQKGLRVFLAESIGRVEPTTSTIFEPIHKSIIAIIVFSENYVNSFCLQELVQILECFKEEGRLIFPVFYDVNPSEVRDQRGSYAKALARLEERFIDKRDQVEEWRQALSQAAEIKGYHFQTRTMYLHEFIGPIVEEVTARINKNEEVKEEQLIGSYDVFLSFHGHTRFSFSGILHNSLCQKELRAFRDESIRPGEHITSTIFKAIHKSRIAIIIFSKDYVNSFPLQELVDILECFKENRCPIYLVFYDMDPSEVRDQRGSYAKAWTRLEEIFKDQGERVENWRCALSEVANISSVHHFLPKTMKLNEFIGTIVDEVTAWIYTINETTDCRIWEITDELIGSGTFGNVYVARHRVTEALRAVKVLNISNGVTDESILNEVKILSELDHPNIVKYYNHKKDENGCICLYMEYVEPGSLKKYISKSEGGSKGMHSKLGTERYAAPEVRQNETYKSSHEAFAADIWSLGCVIIEMSSGREPGLPDFDSHLHIPQELCQEGKDFLKLCFIRNPVERPFAATLLNHPFVKPQADALMEESARIDGVETC